MKKQDSEFNAQGIITLAVVNIGVTVAQFPLPKWFNMANTAVFTNLYMYMQKQLFHFSVKIYLNTNPFSWVSLDIKGYISITADELTYPDNWAIILSENPR